MTLTHPPLDFIKGLLANKNSVGFIKAVLLFSSTQKTNHPNAKEETNFFHLRPIFDVVVVPPR